MQPTAPECESEGNCISISTDLADLYVCTDDTCATGWKEDTPLEFTEGDKLNLKHILKDDHQEGNTIKAEGFTFDGSEILIKLIDVNPQ